MGHEVTSSEISQLIQRSNVIICMGTGGVGKTTISTALAMAAAEQGKRVLTLTIDPSQRLKTLLGLNEDGSVQKVALKDGLFMDAAVVNHQQVFADFISKALKNNPERITRLLNNRLYQQLVTQLSGSQDFTSLQRLYQGHKDGSYDLVILDTPPAQHAIDFLKAPQKLSALFQEGVAKWFRASTSTNIFQRVVQAGTLKAIGLIEGLTGKQFFTELRDFFENIQGWSERLEGRLTEIHRLLGQPSTSFVLVCGHDQTKLFEAESVARELRITGYQLQMMILNRTHPLWMETARSAEWAGLRSDLEGYFGKKQKVFDAWLNRQAIQCPVVQIPELNQDMRDIADVQGIVEYLVRPGKGSE